MNSCAPFVIFLLAFVVTWNTGHAQCLSLCAGGAQRCNLTYTQLSSALNSIPYSQLNQMQIIDTLLQTVPSYTFIDISQDSPDLNIPMKVNLFESLTALKQQTFANDAALQQAIANVFVPLHDAHTRYNKPAPYLYTIFQLPFVFQTIVTLGTFGGQIVTLQAVPSLLETYTTLYNESLLPENMSIDGYQVALIDGSDAFTTILEYANNTIGYSKDLGSRFNLAFRSFAGAPGHWAFRAMALYGIPPTESVTLTLMNINSNSPPINITVKWMGLYSSQLPDNQTDCINGNVVQPQPTGEHELEFMHRLMKATYLPNEIPWENSDLQPTLKSSDGNVLFYQFNLYGVLRIVSFSPTAVAYPSYISTIEAALMKLNGSLLALDLRGNGGGNICLGYAILRYLFPGLSQYVGTYDFIHSETYDVLVNAGVTAQSTGDLICGIGAGGFFAPCQWYNSAPPVPTCGEFAAEQFLNADWYDPGVTYVRGGVNGTYSSLVRDNCDDYYSMFTPGQLHLNLAPNNVILLSDGLCGSTCAVFSRFIQAHNLGKTIVIGGIQNQSQSFNSFPGGQVATIEFFHQAAKSLSVNSSAIPQTLPNNATFRFTLREIYGWTDTDAFANLTAVLPLEFSYLPSDFRINYQADYSDSTIYGQLVPFFSMCISNTISCPIANGTGLYACEEGSRVYCQVQICDPGFYINGTNNCTVCPKGTYKTASDDACLPCVNIKPKGSYYSEVAFTNPQCPYKFPNDPGRVNLSVELFVGIVILEFIGTAVLALLGAYFFYQKRIKHQPYTQLPDENTQPI